MKKFILFLLILPLTLMARPEKKWLQTPVAGLYGKLTFTYTANCQWTLSHGLSWSNFGADDDCDDNARTKYGRFNSTDVTCTDGSGNGCDGAYVRIRFSRMLAGHYLFVFSGITYNVGAGNCGFRFSDGTNFTTVVDVFDQTNTQGHGIIVGSHTQLTESGEALWYVQAYDAATSCTINALKYTDNNLTISVYYFPLNNEYIITK